MSGKKPNLRAVAAFVVDLHLAKKRIAELEEQLEAYQAHINNIRNAAQDRCKEGANERGWISAAWIEDACDRADGAARGPATYVDPLVGGNPYPAKESRCVK